MKKLILITIILASFIGCNREIPNPVTNPVASDMPATPTGLSLSVGDRTLHLSWQVTDSLSIAGYRIYRAEFRADSLDEEYACIDSSSVTEYIDSNLQNGHLYYYKVSAFNQDRLEGQLSSRIGGIPDLYSLIINNGNATTNTRNVVLTFAAPQSTALIQIANSSDFTDSQWEPFSGTRPWVLSDGIGLKAVYAMFRNSEGNITDEYVSDDITYEILPYQYSIVINDGAQYAYSRDVELIINAPSGTLYMMISNSADYSDAVWENYSIIKPWFIASETAVNGDTVTFYTLFRDENNDSLSVEATNSIILFSSDPVDLMPVYQEPDYYQSIDLQWSRSLSEDFYSYRLYRSKNTSSVDTIITTIDNITQTSYTDDINISDLPSGAIDSVYYMVRFYSEYDDSSDSDTILVTLENIQPPAVSCFVGDVAYDSNDAGGFDLQATLGWSRSEIPDFQYYVVYENTSSDTITAGPVSYLYDIGDLMYSINKSIDSLDASYAYYYWLKVFDQGGLNSGFSSPDSITN